MINLKVITHAIALITGIVIAVVCFRSCEQKPEIRTETVTVHDTTIQVVELPPLTGNGKGRVKYTYSGMVHDTITERIYITTERGDTVSEFTAVLDTIQDKDTLHLEYTYPLSMFKYQLNRQPNEIQYINTVTTNTVTIQPPKLSFGLQFGVGYLVSFRTGQSAIGGYFGVGGNYRL